MSSPDDSAIEDHDPRQAFMEAFGKEPELVITAPGRINLIGEHVDYLDGLVMPAAIERSLQMAIAPSAEPIVRLWTAISEGDAPITVALDDLQPRTGNDSWLNYVVGVLEMMRRRGIELPGFDAAIIADLPSGAGLSSSAALETASALSVEALTGVDLDPVERARICQQAEHEFAGVPCGLMDQLAVGLGQAGHALMIDCRDVKVTPVPIPAGISMVVADTRVKHALGDGEYRARREDCEAARQILGVASLRDATLDLVLTHREALGDRLFRRARHAVTEIARVTDLAAALEATDAGRIAAIMREGHESLRDDFEVSCEELDALVEAAYDFGIERGVLGSRMTGGGFGGSTISLVRTEAAEDLVRHLESSYRERFDREPNCFITKAAPGAHALSVGEHQS